MIYITKKVLKEEKLPMTQKTDCNIVCLLRFFFRLVIYPPGHLITIRVLIVGWWW